MARKKEDVTDADLARWMATLTALREDIRRFSTTPPAKQRNRRLKMPRGAAQVVAHVVQFARDRKLPFSGVDTSTLESRLALARRFRQLAREGVYLDEQARSAAMYIESGVWSETTALYSTFLRFARNDLTMRADLGVARAFFKKQRNHKKDEAEKNDAKKNEAAAAKPKRKAG